MESKKKKKVMKNLGQDGNKHTDLLENGLEDTGRGKGKLGQSGRVVWTYIHYQTYDKELFKCNQLLHLH